MRHCKDCQLLLLCCEICWAIDCHLHKSMALRRCLQPWLQQNMYLIEQRVPQAAWAYSSSSSKPEQQQDKQQQHVAETQQQQASPAAAPSQSTTSDTLATAASRPKGAEEWTEVIDEKSGQTYYWNEKTGRASGCAGCQQLRGFISSTGCSATAAL